MSKKIIGITVGTTMNPNTLSEYVQNGKSAYELAVENGFKGTEAEWLASLHAEDGKDGKDGKDGYTPIKGVDYFDGKDGATGPQGPQGPQGESTTSWVLSMYMDKAEDGTVAVKLFKDGVICKETKYMASYVSSGGGEWRQHGGSTGNISNGSKSWTFGGTNKGMAWRAEIYEDNTKSVLLTSGYIAIGPIGAEGIQGPIGPQGEQGEKGKDGVDGKDGANGSDGNDGYTPIKGTDYWTEEDKAEIKSYVDDAILGGAW